MQYLAGGLCAGIAALSLRRHWWAAVALACALWHLVGVAPWYWGGPAPPAAAGRAVRLRLLLANVHTANRDHGRLLDLVRRVRPQLLVLQEVDRRWIAALQPLRRSHAHFVEHPRPDNFGIALYSELPLRAARVVFVGSGLPSVLAELQLSAQRTTLLATHPFPPLVAAQSRNRQLEAVATLLQRRGRPRLLVGDLNVTMWSPVYQRLVRRTGLINARRGWGILPSWPLNAGPLGLMRIPIDHALHDAELVVTR